MFQSTRTRSSGISVLEVLVALGVLVVIVSFASPSLSSITARAELQSAVENAEFSIQMARSTARELETDVVMHLKTGRHEKQHSISFSFPNRKAELNTANLLQEIQFPPDIRLVTDESSVHFDSRGLVEVPVQVLLVSNLDEDFSERLLIQ